MQDNADRIDSKSENTPSGEWVFDGSAWEFVRMVQWALVFRKLCAESTIPKLEIMKSDEKVRQKAVECGMTLPAIIKEMNEMCDAINTAQALADLKRRSGIQTDKYWFEE